jgi:hypothetical protein
MGPDLIPCHLAICENRKEGIGGVVRESPAILRKRRWARGIIREDLRQYGPSHPPRFLRVIPTHMLQRMAEGGNETDIVRLPCEIGISLRAGETEKKEKLQGPRAALRLDPTPIRAVRSNQRAVPQANCFAPQGKVRNFEHDAAHILVGEEIVTGELQIVYCTPSIEEKWIAATPREESVDSSPFC